MNITALMARIQVLWLKAVAHTPATGEIKNIMFTIITAPEWAKRTHWCYHYPDRLF